MRDLASVGGVPPKRDLPTATFCQPFRLNSPTAIQAAIAYGEETVDTATDPPIGLYSTIVGAVIRNSYHECMMDRTEPSPRLAGNEYVP